MCHTGGMHVLMTADTVGGVWTYCMDLCGELVGRGVGVTLVTMGAAMSQGQRGDTRRFARTPGPRGAALSVGVEIVETTLKLEWMPEPWGDVEAAGRLLVETAGRVRPDVVHLNQFAFGALDFDIPKVVVAHSDVLSWWRAVKGAAAGAEWDRYRAAVRAGLDGADAVVGVTKASLEAMEAEIGLLSRTTVIHNGRAEGLYVHHDYERPSPSPSLRGRGVRREPFILSAGRLWDEAKGVATLEAAAGLGLDWPVRVAGEDEAKAERLHVQPLGRLSAESLAEHMKRAGIYCLPARYEPFGLSPLEAAIAGCPPVLGDIPTLREVWGDAAEYVPPGDAEALQHRLNGLIADPDRRLALAAAAGERARRYTPARMAEAYLSLYRELTGIS